MCSLYKQEKKSKVLEQAELSDIDNVEKVSGKDFSFEVRFRDRKKSSWEFGALSEVELQLTSKECQ